MRNFIHKHLLIYVGPRFVTTHNNVGFARKKVQTISFIERGFERLGLSHRTVISHGVHIKLNRVRFEESFSWRRTGRLWFLAIFPSPSPRSLVPLFILVCILYPSSTYRIDFSKTDTYPISPYPKWLGVVVKVEEYGSVRCRMLYCSSGSLLLMLFRTVITLPFRGIYGMPNRSSSSAISLDRPRLS